MEVQILSSAPNPPTGFILQFLVAEIRPYRESENAITRKMMTAFFTAKLQFMTKPAHSGIRKIWRSFGYARDGLVAAFRDEVSLRQEIYCVVPAILAALFLPISSSEKVLLIFVSLQILLAELFNTAIEILCDLICPDENPQIKKAKDVGALIVLFAIVSAVIVWVGVLWQLF